MAFSLTSSAFPNGSDIAAKYTCQGEDVSPELSWTEPPKGTQSFALIVNDPDAPVGDWTHWVLYDVPATARRLDEGVARSSQLSDGSRQGMNDFRRVGYGGPCPPPGKPHRYFFRLYALDRKLDVAAGVPRGAVESAMKGHVLGQAELMGRYQRK